jgi:hypothetical protein
MKRILVVLFFMLIAIPVFAESENKWTALDTGLQLSLTSIGIVDMVQTWMALKHDPDYREMNPIIYGRPNDALFFSVSFSALAIHAVISYLLPQPWRFLWQCVWISVEFYSVCNNWSVGARFQY